MSRIAKAVADRGRASPLVLSLIALAAGGSASASVPSSIADAQKQQVEAILVDMNQSAQDVAGLIDEPQSAWDAGCLDDLMSVDLSVFTIDFTNIWGALYQTMKDQIVNMACSAATDWVNQQTQQLQTQLQAPFGLGGISITQGTGINEWQSAVTGNVELDNTELNQQVSTATLGTIPAAIPPNTAPKAMFDNGTTPVQNREALEGQIEEMLDVRQLFNEGGQ
jgi:hypothetical protein